MNIKPILFSTQMVKAILEGRKTQTRRIIKPTSKKGCYGVQVERDKTTGEVTNVTGYDEHERTWDENGSQYPVNNKYKIGDILWVRETWTQNGIGYYRYKADFKEGEGLFTGKQIPAKYRNKWKPSIYMPREAARIFLNVTNVRVERLQDITEEDAIAEGVETLGLYPGYEISAIGKFEGLWSNINGQESWNDNPFVWVYEIEKIEKK